MSTSSSQRVYNDRRWKIIRAAAIQRAGGMCELRLPGCTGRATQGEHTVALEDGGQPFSLANAAASCRHCNVAKENDRRPLRQAAKTHAPSRSW